MAPGTLQREVSSLPPMQRLLLLLLRPRQAAAEAVAAAAAAAAAEALARRPEAAWPEESAHRSLVRAALPQVAQQLRRARNLLQQRRLLTDPPAG